MNMFIAKPFGRNLVGAKQFETLRECKKFLDEITDQKMPVQDWIVLGKILCIDESGATSPIEVDLKEFA